MNSFIWSTRWRHSWKAIAVGALVAIALTGCFLVPARPTLDSVVGTWRHEETGHTSTLEILDDGTFVLENAPVEFFTIGFNSLEPDWDGVIDWSKAVTIEGDTSFGERTHKLQLVIEEPAEVPAGVMPVSKAFGRDALFVSLGDGPDRTLTFDRVE